VPDGNKSADDRQARNFRLVLDKQADNCQHDKLGGIVENACRLLGTSDSDARGVTANEQGDLRMTDQQRAPQLREHPLRGQLNDEVHARPSESLVSPARISFLAMFTGDQNRDREWPSILRLADRFGVTLDERPRSHLSVDLGPFRLRYERHSEFSRYKFIVPGGTAEPFSEVALSRVPADWLEQLGGELITATHVEIMAVDDVRPTYEDVASRFFDGNALVGADIGEGAATALTDFRVRADGFGRVLLLDRSLTPRQTGRMLQRLMEIDTYRIMGLLALPVARELAPFLKRGDEELAAITAALTTASERDEPVLLERLTLLAASIENRIASNEFRFGAAVAYYGLVQRRIAELREVRIPGLPTFLEFTERRLAPAMNTCQTMAHRQESLSARVARANELLATRVDITREGQNQALLASMDRRAKVQLHLQQTVEGLSVAAFTYYVVGLVGYLAKGLKAAGIHLDVELTMGISLPIIAIVAALGMQQIRRMISRRNR